MNIERIKQWTAEAERGLNQTLRDDTEALKQQVNSGIAELWRINGDSWMISRVEQYADKNELVVCCFQGKDLLTIGTEIIGAAKEQGLHSIRFHTQRKGLNRLLKPFGFRYLETVYHKVL